MRKDQQQPFLIAISPPNQCVQAYAVVGRLVCNGSALNAIS